MPNERRLRSFLKDRFSQYHDQLGRDDSLASIVDSLGLFELVEFVEHEFGIQVPTAEFSPQKFSSIQRILDFVEDLRADRACHRAS